MIQVHLDTVHAQPFVQYFDQHWLSPTTLSMKELAFDDWLRAYRRKYEKMARARKALAIQEAPVRPRRGRRTSSRRAGAVSTVTDAHRVRLPALPRHSEQNAPTRTP